ncbi:MAG: rod shape-determining protein RodA [Deltaproteobacteria bacterium]|nr:rod shape-determining protein RodA [Deltaproteobacteria bacterium]
MIKLDLDRRLLENFSWPLILSLGGLLFFGLVNLYSTAGGHIDSWNAFTRQFLFISLGLGLLLGSLFIDYHVTRRLAVPLLAISILLLILTKYAGVTVNGATRWIQVSSFFRFQPSELMKVVIVLTLAAYLSAKDFKNGLDFKDLPIPLLIVGVPAFMIAKQPDVGTALHLVLTAIPIFLFRKVRTRVLAVLVSIAIAVPVWLFSFGGLNYLLEHKVIKVYHLQRYDTFKDPEKDPNGKGWQITQSKSAIGSGQLVGRGYMSGSQQRFGFLPAADTDFAFAALAEEWGFLGSSVVLTLFFILLWAGLGVVRRSGDMFGALLALGLTSILFWQMTINVAMVMGLFPVVGIPLPFISYGGSSTLISLVGVGLIANVGMRRYLFLDEAVQQNPKVWEKGVPEPVLQPLTVRRLAPHNPDEPEQHPAHRLPHCRPWLKHFTKKSWIQHEYN